MSPRMGRAVAKSPPNLTSHVNKTNDDDIYFPAEAEITRRRLVQSPVPTMILEALLGTVLLLHLVSRTPGPRSDILPRSPRSIASGLALIAGGNLFDFLTAGRARDIEDLDGFARTGLFDGRVAWFGWKDCGDDAEERTAVARYGIWILTPGEVAEAVDRQKREQDAPNVRRDVAEDQERGRRNGDSAPQS